jgi:hypothetical protein
MTISRKKDGNLVVKVSTPKRRKKRRRTRKKTRRSR